MQVPAQRALAALWRLSDTLPESAFQDLKTIRRYLCQRIIDETKELEQREPKEDSIP